MRVEAILSKRFIQDNPDSITAEQGKWLCAIGAEQDPDQRNALIDQHPEWLTESFIAKADVALTTLSPAQAERMLPCGLGLLRAAERVDTPTAKARAHFRYGFLLAKANQPTSALEQFEAARALFEQIPLPAGTLLSLFNIGNTYNDMGKYREAIPPFEKARELCEQQGNISGIGKCEMNIGIAHYRLGDFKTARTRFDAAIKRFREADDPQGETDCLMNTGAIYAAEARTSEAMEYYLQAKRRFSELKHTPGVAYCAYNLATLYLDQQRYEVALIALQEARELFANIKDERQLFLCDMLQGDILSTTGYFSEAITFYRQAQARKNLPPEQTGLVCLSHGITLIRMKRGSEAAKLFEKARDVFEQAGSARYHYYAIYRLAQAHYHQKTFAQAIAAFEQALSFANQHEDEYTAALCERGIGQSLAEQNKHAEAIERYSRALLSLERFNDQVSCLRCVFDRMLSHRKLGQKAQALADSRDTIRRMSEPDIQNALTALSASGELNLPGVIAYAVAAEIEQGEPEHAFQAAQIGRGALARQAMSETRQPPVKIPDTQVQELARLRTAYQNAQKRAAQGAFDRETLKAREDALAAWTAYELNLRAKHPQWNRLEAQPATLQQIARALGPHQAVIEMFLTQDQLCLLLIRADKGAPVLHTAVVKTNFSRLEQEANQFARMLQTASAESVKKPAQNLYKQLIAPLEPRLKGIKTLIFCPDFALHRLPLDALVDSQGRFLVQRFGLTTAPSASAWEACHSVGQQRAKESSRASSLLVAVSRFQEAGKSTVALARGRLQDLPHAREEAKAIQTLKPKQWTALTENQATVARMTAAMPKARRLHFATHAVLNETLPMMSALVARSSDGKELDYLYARDVYGLRLKAQLVTLSACSTAEGRESMEGLVGLSWAFLVAGCPAVLATRWRIQDKAAREWITAFYRALDSGQSIAAAKQTACQQRIRANAPPRDWAVWTLIGYSG